MNSGYQLQPPTGSVMSGSSSDLHDGHTQLRLDSNTSLQVVGMSTAHRLRRAPRRSSRRRAISLVLLLLYLPSCSSYQVLPGVPPAPLPAGTSDLRLTLTDSSRVILRHASFRADTLFGIRQIRGQPGPVAATIPWESVARVEQSRISLGKTLARGGLFMLVGTAFFGLLIASSDCFPMCGE